LNDGGLGTLLPSIEAFYSVDYAVVSLVFMAKAVGFIVASIMSNKLHIYLGRCKSLVIGSCAQGLSYVMLALAPPYPVVIIAFCFAGAGIGFQLAHMNTYMVHPHLFPYSFRQPDQLDISYWGICILVMVFAI
jgi:MFS family permease